jgi:hypothetical protein
VTASAAATSAAPRRAIQRPRVAHQIAGRGQPGDDAETRGLADAQLAGQRRQPDAAAACRDEMVENRDHALGRGRVPGHGH